MLRRTNPLVLGVVIASVVAIVAAPAHAVAPDDGASSQTAAEDSALGHLKITEKGHLGSVGVEEPLPAETQLLEPQAAQTLSEGTLDIETSLAVTDIVMSDRARTINTVTWDRATDTVKFWAHGQTTALQKRIADSLPERQAWTVEQSERPVAELEAIIESIAYDPEALPDGVRFASGTASPDGSSITIGVMTGSEVALGRMTLPQQIDGVNVEYEAAELAAPTGRTRTTAPIISGGQTWRATGQGTCTQGFPVLRYQDSQPNSLTADHCTAAQGEDWRWGGGSISIGASTFQHAGDTDLELYTNPGQLSTWMLAGPNTDNNTVAPIRGYIAPVGGTAFATTDHAPESCAGTSLRTATRSAA